MSKAFIQYNDDATNLWDVEPGRARASLIELIDRVIDAVPIDVYSVECALPDLCEHNTRVGEQFGERFGYDEKLNRRLRGIKALREEGADHLSVYIERLHQRNIRCVAEVRMSDTHYTRLDPGEPVCAMFDIEHPQWVIRRDDGVAEVALDYSYPEVRAHRLAIMTELAEQYDVDGLELNFNRWAKHFDRREARAKAPVMTDFVGEIHAMLARAAKRRGRDRLMLGARVLSTLEECLDAGCDPRVWVEKGWLDYLIVAEYNCTWPGTRVDEFAPFCRGRCKLLAQMGDGNGGVWKGRPAITGRGEAMHAGFGACYAGMLLTPAEARGAAHNFYTWGANGISFWNICCTIGTRGKQTGQAHRRRMFAWMNEVVDPEKVRRGSRCYHYLPLYKGMDVRPGNYAVRRALCSPNGAFKGTVLEFTDAMRGVRQVFPFRMADGRQGEALRGELRWRVLHCPGCNPFTVDINGVTMPAAQLRMEPDEANVDLGARWLSLDLTQCPPLRGDNELGLTWIGPIAKSVAYVEELEVMVE